MVTKTIEEMFSRKSVRTFTGEKIPVETKNLILEAAVNAPTAGCQQLYTIIDVMDQNLKELNQRLPHYSRIAEIELRQEEFAKTPKKSIKRYLYN